MPPLQIRSSQAFDGLRLWPKGLQITVENGLITKVQDLASVRSDAHNDHGELIDLGDAWLLPGWVNAHAHLELSLLQGCLPRQVPFTQWLDSLRASVKDWNLTQYREGVKQGATQALQSGTTTLFDIGNTQASVLEAVNLPIRVLPVREWIGQSNVFDLDEVPGYWTHAVHAVHSTSSQMIEAVGDWALQYKKPWSIHLAESAEEIQLLTQGTGLFRDWLDMHVPSHEHKAPGLHPWNQLIAGSASVKGLLAVHANLIDDSMLESMLQLAVTIVHCPQSRRWFAHPMPPLQKAHSLGVPICLATDSLASAESLHMVAQLLLAQIENPWWTLESLLASATSVPAKALGIPTGVLAVGNWADWVAWPASLISPEQNRLQMAAPLMVSVQGIITTLQDLK